MTREQLEHIIRAAAAITGEDELVIIGSQAVLGTCAEPDKVLAASFEADLFSLKDPHAADLIDGSIGERSTFHQTFGVYGHGVGVETAILPEGWRERLVRLSTPGTRGATGLCLEVHDLAVSKLAAGREKDIEYVQVLVATGLARRDVIAARISTIQEPHRSLSKQRLGRLN
jgi:hypothetical protein